MTGKYDQSAIPPAALALGLAGLIPFAAGALAAWLPQVLPGPGLRLLVVYGALILTFLGGIRWGTAIGPYDGRRQSIEFAASVIGSLLGLAALFLPPMASLTLLIAGFLVQGLWDISSVESGRLPMWFGRFRMILTTGAVLALVLGVAAVAVT